MATTFSRIFDWDDNRWRNRAACRDSDPDVFFPVGSTGVAAEAIKVAKDLCGTCLVRTQCLAFALETNQEAGVWGGASEDERRQLRQGARSRRQPVARW
jgi:WhiB family transcriptional regulator, redox-sensing transcriptional regulator